jgi:SRSO17 transposase
MADLAEFERYMKGLCERLGHADRRAGFMQYSQGLMLPIERKSVEPLAAHTDPRHVSAKHQSLHHLVAKSEWSDEGVLEGVREWVSPRLKLENDCFWIVDDTGFPKKGKHSVGVARQYCGQLGKQDNCQVAVSLSLASSRGSLPITYRLYLPQEWADDRARRERAGVPTQITFATKPQIALEQIRTAKASGVPAGVVLADAAYGNDTSFRERLSEMGLRYSVGVHPTTSVWPPGVEPLPPRVKKRVGRPGKLLRRGRGHKPCSVKQLARSLSPRAWREVSWREGTNATLRSRFAAVRVRAASRDYWRATVRDEEWLLIEWPRAEREPIKYVLSTLSADTSLKELVAKTMMRWRIERDYQELKQEFGLSHYEGRGWRGFHHHATLCIAAYGFLLGQRLSGGGEKKNSARSPSPLLPEGYRPRGSPQGAAPRTRLHRDAPPSALARHRAAARPLPLLRAPSYAAELMTQ